MGVGVRGGLMNKHITAEQIIKFREDLLSMDVNSYMDFVMPLTKREFGILSNLMVHNCVVQHFGIFVKIMEKFYKFKEGKQ